MEQSMEQKARALTLAEAKKLSSRTTLYHLVKRNADGKTAMRVRVTSVRVWKTRPGEVRVGVVRGLRDFDTLDERDLEDWSLTDPTR